jgi:putative oxidoreductase
MKIVFLICRVLLGLGFVVFGLNGFLHFIPMGPEPPADSLIGKFMAAMTGSGWMKVVAAMQILGGLLVLIGGTAPLGLAILAPILFNILCFHILLTGGAQIGGGLVFSVLELVLIYAYRPYFSGLFATKATTAV